MKTILLLALLLSSAVSLAASPCEEAIKAMEDPANVSKERVLAMSALKLCQNEKVVNPQMSLANIEIKEKKFQEAIKWSEDALKIIPDLALPYLNICAAYHGLKQYDQAIANCKKGLSFEWVWGDHLKALLNGNLALAIFTKGANDGNMQTIAESEKYFLESVKLDPTLAQNYYFLGKIEAVNKDNNKNALFYYKKGCDLKHDPSCKDLKLLESQPKPSASAPIPSTGPANKLIPLTPKEIEIYEKLAKGYEKKGIPKDKIQDLVTNIKKSMEALSPEQRVQSLEAMLKAIQ
jgi:tetratricopeptide (TPR) repeat protein